MESEFRLAEDGDIFPFRDALYRSSCTTCGRRLYWSLYPDPDGPVWTYRCCDRKYQFTVHTVEMHNEPDED